MGPYTFARTNCPSVSLGNHGWLSCAETGPLYVKVEKGQTSRIAPRPLKGAYLNITGNSRIDNRADYRFQVSDYGVNFVQFSANYNVGAKFTVYMGAHACLPYGLCFSPVEP